MIANEEKTMTSLFKNIVDQFIAAIFEEKQLLTWATLCQMQMHELQMLMDGATSGNSTSTSPKVPGIKPLHSKPSTSSCSNETPSKSRSISHIKRFSPLVNENCKIRCTVAGCMSRFAHKRSYHHHMKKYHRHEKIDYMKKDPPGTCLMISAKTNLPCRAKLPYRSIYQHLETHHKIKRPDNKILFGFDLSGVPKPVFVSKGEELEMQDEEHDIPLDGDPSSQELEHEGDSETQMKEAETADFEEVPNEILNELAGVPEEKDDTTDIPNDSDMAGILSLPDEQKFQLISALEETIPSDMDGSYLLNIEDPNLQETVSHETNLNVTADDKSYPEPLLTEPPSLVMSSPTRGEKRKYSGLQKLSVVFNDMYADIEDEILLTHPEADAETDIISDASSDEPLDEKDSNITIDERIFSDWEDGDEELYTKTRRRNKTARHMRRNTKVVALQDREQNSQFIADFTKYMTDNIIQSQSGKSTTLSKALRNLYHQEDSLLAYHSELDSMFCLENFRDITSQNFTLLPFPADWIVSTSGKDGNKGLDRLKSHSALRQFLAYEVAKYTDPKYADIKKACRENLEGIEKQVTGNRLFKRYNTLSKQKKQKKDKALMILAPSRNLHIENIVKKWNDSLEKEEIERDHDFIYQNSIEAGEISPKNLTRFSMFARFTLLMRLGIQNYSLQFTLQTYKHIQFGHIKLLTFSLLAFRQDK